MISIVYCTINPNPQHTQHLKRSVGIKDVEIIEYINKGEGLTKFYNKALEETTNDIVVFCHDDISINTTKWGKKIIKHFNETDFGILGVAGTTDLPSTGRWWDDTGKMLGQVKHIHEGKHWNSIYCPNFGEKILPSVIVDGLFFVVNKKRIKESFDNDFKGFHFYEIDFCLANHLLDTKVGVMSNIRIAHKSIGKTNEEWENNRKQFVKKYEMSLPQNIKGQIFYDNTYPYIKSPPHVGIIIPTKGNIELLTQCVNSIWEKDDYPTITIYIADTGSTPKEKEKINELIDQHSTYSDRPRKIKLIEYYYYNFAQINNDVVKNHVDDCVEILLFCNNDIKLINNAISKMVNVFDKKRNVGTVGARLYFGDGKIQHSGIITFLDEGQNIRLSHKGLFTYYNYHPHTTEVLGNTAAFMMIKKEIFNKLGQFNEDYIECFEDVELNVTCLSKRLKNYFVSEAVCYHYESQTRNNDKEKNKRQGEDHFNRIIPFIINNKRSYDYFENISAEHLDRVIKKIKKEEKVI